MPNPSPCQQNILRMLENSQTKVIFPIMTYGLLLAYMDKDEAVFLESEVRNAYNKAVKFMEGFLGHNLHIGGKYYDAYPMRNLPRYDVLRVMPDKRFELQAAYRDEAADLISWIPSAIRDHITNRLGIIPDLGRREFRSQISADSEQFAAVISENIDRTAANFEIFSFAVIRVHLEKFACKVYRDTRTSAHDSGVDLSTNFGVVYQVKKLKVVDKDTARNLYTELKGNFDTQRLNDGNVILVIDDISKEIKQFLLDMKVQSLSKQDLLKLTSQFEDMEDREKVLRIVYEEYQREYASAIR